LTAQVERESISSPPGHIPGCSEVSPYQAFDNFQQLLHDHSNALVTQESADGLEVRGAHEIPVGAVDVAVGNVERLENRSCGKVSDPVLKWMLVSTNRRCFAVIHRDPVNMPAGRWPQREKVWSLTTGWSKIH
jgi:hypothetical protein